MCVCVRCNVCVCVCVMYNHSSLFSGGQAVVVAQGTLSVDVCVCALIVEERSES